VRRALLALTLTCLSPGLASAETRATDEARSVLKDGVSLVAVAQVVVGGATLPKGMKVTVTKVHLSGDKPTCADLALPDGFVARAVSLPTILAHFTRA
jgi:hypothetical protein